MTQPPLKMSDRGFGLIGVLVSITLLSLFLLWFSQAVNQAQVAERGIASNIELSDLNSTVQTILSRPESCIATGLLNVDISSLKASPPSPVDVTLFFPPLNPLDTPMPLLVPGTSPIPTRNISAVYLSQLIPLIPGSEYLATLTYKTTIIGKAMTNRGLQNDIHFQITVDPLGLITACRGAGAPARRERCMTASIQKSYAAGSANSQVKILQQSDPSLTFAEVFEVRSPTATVPGGYCGSTGTIPQLPAPYLKCQPGFRLTSCNAYLTADYSQGAWAGSEDPPLNYTGPPIVDNPRACSALHYDFFCSTSANLSATCCE